MCPSLSNNYNTTTEDEYTEAVNVGWYSRISQFWDRITLNQCSGSPYWMTYLIYTPVVITGIYLIALIIRGGG